MTHEWSIRDLGLLTSLMPSLVSSFWRNILGVKPMHAHRRSPLFRYYDVPNNVKRSYTGLFGTGSFDIIPVVERIQVHHTTTTNMHYQMHVRDTKFAKTTTELFNACRPIFQCKAVHYKPDWSLICLLVIVDRCQWIMTSAQCTPGNMLYRAGVIDYLSSRDSDFIN